MFLNTALPSHSGAPLHGPVFLIVSTIGHRLTYAVGCDALKSWQKSSLHYIQCTAMHSGINTLFFMLQGFVGFRVYNT